MEWDLQFVAIIVTVLLAIGGGFWRIIATMNKGFAEARREAREGRKEAREAVDKLRAEMNAGFAKAKEEREKGFAAAKKAREKGFAEAKEAREKGFAEEKEAREKGFTAEKEAREKGFAALEKAMEKGFADAKEERREIKNEMNRRFDAVETRIARLEAPYFQKKSQDQGRPVERVAEPRPSEEYAAASGHTGESVGAAGREAASPDESDEDSAELADGISAGAGSVSSS